MAIPTTNPVSLELHHEISQFYYREARTLQERRHDDWLEQFIAEDIHYWMPIRELRYAKDKRPEPTPDDAAIYNDNYDDLKLRVGRLKTGQVWMEDPPSRIRYMISNIEAYHSDKSDEIITYCNLSVHRHRRQTDETQHRLGREDTLRITDNGLRVARRKLLIDARVTQDKNLYFFA
jgi:3-phenylpropionate/cinnamic acid dioxygenase small subunit